MKFIIIAIAVWGWRVLVTSSSPNNSGSSTVSTNPYAGQTCHHHWECRDSPEQSSGLREPETKSNETVSVKIFQCCGANESRTTTSNKSGQKKKQQQQQVMSPGICCYKEPLTTTQWVLIVILAVLFVLASAVAITWSRFWLRPRLWAYQRSETRRLRTDMFEMLTSLKLLSRNNDSVSRNSNNAPNYPTEHLRNQTPGYPVGSREPEYVPPKDHGYPVSPSPQYGMVEGQPTHQTVGFVYPSSHNA